MDHSEEIVEPQTQEAIDTLVAHHRELLAFVERRVGDRTLAEEILQDALVRNLGKLDTVTDSVVGWFYRVLRNAIVDHHRRAAARDRREHAYAEHEPPDEDLQRTVCACVGKLASTLKAEYATALRRIEIDGVAVKDYAAEAGISANNAGVRVHRAREALRAQVVRSCGTCAEHGCLDCTCGSSRPLEERP